MAPHRVEDHLLVECAKWTGGTDLLIATATDVDPAAYFEAELRALAAIGALSEDEVAAWRRRLETSARADDELVVDDPLRARTERYLESLLPAAPDEEWSGRLEAALQVLTEIGILDDAEHARWLNRAYAAEDGEEEDDEDEDEWTALDARELHGVLLGPREEADGIRITGLELYSGGVVVRWSARHGALGDDEPEPYLALSDDRGTAYEATGGESGSGGSELTRGATEFVPGVPETASRLVLRWPGGSTAFELGG